MDFGVSDFGLVVYATSQLDEEDVLPDSMSAWRTELRTAS